MRNLFFLASLVLLISIFCSCTVNETTGLIRVENRAYFPIQNLKIGDKLIVSYLDSGFTYNYWYYSEIKGKIYSEKVLVKSDQAEWDLTLKPGYWVYITAKYNKSSKEDEITIDVYDEKSNHLDPAEWRDM